MLTPCLTCDGPGVRYTGVIADGGRPLLQADGDALHSLVLSAQFTLFKHSFVFNIQCGVTKIVSRSDHNINVTADFSTLCLIFRLCSVT